MLKRCILRAGATLAVAAAGLLSCGALTASAKPILMPTVTDEIRQQLALLAPHVGAGSLQPPAPPCPENGLLPSTFSNCGLPQLPATTLPFPGNMAYWGGHVQVKPKVYLVYWGWGQPGAFPSTQACHKETLTEGPTTAKLGCDPDGAGKRMADWVYQLGGTKWAGVATQHYQSIGGATKHITNPTNQLGGIWVNQTNPASGLPKTSSSNPPGATNTYTDLAAEAARAMGHFGITER